MHWTQPLCCGTDCLRLCSSKKNPIRLFESPGTCWTILNNLEYGSFWQTVWRCLVSLVKDVEIHASEEKILFVTVKEA